MVSHQSQCTYAIPPVLKSNPAPAGSAQPATILVGPLLTTYRTRNALTIQNLRDLAVSQVNGPSRFISFSLMPAFYPRTSDRRKTRWMGSDSGGYNTGCSQFTLSPGQWK